ncbi:MAG: hypothetical protein KAS38_21245, partial [Anaerolineales bacterium]|nr:hypothetical protein [Anaerolineales bacterium]
MAIQVPANQTPTSQSAPPLKRLAASLPRILLHLTLMIGAALCIFPFVFMIVKSFSTVYQASRWPPVWIPARFMFLNYSVAWSSVSFGPTIKVVESGAIRYAYVEFWAIFMVLMNFLIAGVLVGWLGRSLRRLEKNSVGTLL